MDLRLLSATEGGWSLSHSRASDGGLRQGEVQFSGPRGRALVREDTSTCGHLSKALPGELHERCAAAAERRAAVARRAAAAAAIAGTVPLAAAVDDLGGDSAFPVILVFPRCSLDLFQPALLACFLLPTLFLPCFLLSSASSWSQCHSCPASCLSMPCIPALVTLVVTRQIGVCFTGPGIAREGRGWQA